MVLIALTPLRGNHQRFFPHSGFLGLSPIVVEGFVKTAIEEDHKTLKASSVCVRVRCYEADISPGRKKGTKKTHVLFEQEQEVWSSAASRDPGTSTDQALWAPLGDLYKPFQIVIPVENTGVSTTSYRNYRVWWQLEGVIHHKPMSMLGSHKLVSHPIPLIRYASPSASPLPSVSWNSASNPNAFQGLQYSFSTPSPSLLQFDQLAFSVLLRRDDRRLQVRKVQFCLDRHLTVDISMPSPAESDSDDTHSPPGGHEMLSDDPALMHNGRSSSRGLSSVFKRGTSSGDRYSSQARASPLPSPGHLTRGLDAQSYFSFSPSSDSHVSPVPVAIPRGKTTSSTNLMTIEIEDPPFDVETSAIGHTPGTTTKFRYSVGESIRTKIARVFFTISVKIHVRGRTGSTEIIELEPRIVQLAACSALELDQALQQLASDASYSSANVGSSAVRSGSPASAPTVIESTNPQQLPTPPMSIASSLGSRRNNGFRLSVDTARSVSSMPLPLRGHPDDPRAATTVRRRSDHSDVTNAPVKSRARAFASFIPPNHASDVSELSIAPPTPDSPFFDATGTPTPTSFAESLIMAPPQPRHGFFPLAAQPPHVSVDSALTPPLPGPLPPVPRHSRRSARSPGPYSSSNRPRSAGQLSSRSTAASISTLSITSTSSRYSREQSAPLPATSGATLLSPDALPSLSLYPREHEVRGYVPSPLPEQDRSLLISPTPELESTTLSRSSSSSGDDEEMSTAPPSGVDFHSFSLVPGDVRMRAAGVAEIDEATRKVIAPWTVDVSPWDKRAPIPTGMTRSASSGLSPLPIPENPTRRKSSVSFGLFSKGGEDGEEKESGSRWGFLRRGSKA